MTLPSYSFIFIFLPIVVILYYLFNSKKIYLGGKIVLLAASLIFYFSMGWQGFIGLLVSIALCYLIATFGLSAQRSVHTRKTFLVLGIVINVFFLLYCKYLSYFELLINKYSGSNLSFTAIVLPVGISYFTFSQIAYLVDSYRNPDLKYSILDYALFVSFFPKVTVGPIALSTEMIPQFNDITRKNINYTLLAKGFYRFTLGLSKKLLIADNLSLFVDLCFTNYGVLGTTNALLASVSYTLQIYFDFSGYCDIAIGICEMLGLELIDNFDAPYKAISISDFWKRWHISLTRFFRTYIYIPLGGNRKGKFRTYLNTMIIFLISGLWHGSATTFVVWGAVHGLGSIISKIIAPIMNKVPKFIRWFLTFSFVNLAWILFRAPDLETAMAIYEQLFTGGFKPINIDIIAACIPPEGQLIQWIVLKYAKAYTYYSGCTIMLAVMGIGLLLCTLTKTAASRVASFSPTKLKVVTTVILFVWSVLSLSQVSEFIYVNF